MDWKNTAFVKIIKGTCMYGKYESEIEKISWSEYIKGYDLNDVYSVAKDQLSGYSNVILLPDETPILEGDPDKTVILISEGLESLFKKIFPGFANSIWEVSERINPTGSVSVELSEPEINKALRFVFNKKPNTLIIALCNSVFNPLHTQSLQNILNIAGYKTHNKYSANC